MTEQLISFDTAVLAKRKGLSIKTEMTYEYGGHIVHKSWLPVKSNPFLPCCTQSLLQKWLRETHDIKLCVSWTDNDKYLFEINHKQDGMSGFDTYEEALEDGLVYALQLIK